jgi:hypothetical protein
VVGVTLVSGPCQSCRVHVAFNKTSVRGFSSSSPARTSGGEDASRLLAQPALRLKSASLARSRSDLWDVSRQMALPLAYPDSLRCRRCLIKDTVGRKLKAGTRKTAAHTGTTFSLGGKPAGGNNLLLRWEAGAAVHGGANFVAAIDSSLICIGPLGALPTQTDNGQKTADLLSTGRCKRIKSDAI